MAVKDIVEKVWNKGGKLMLDCGIGIPDETPVQNVRAMFDASTFFVVQRTAQGWRPTLNVLDLADRHFAARDEIGRWAFFTPGSYGEGSLIGAPERLPPDGRGRPRFYVNASTNGDGFTRPWQLSVWEWTGAVGPSADGAASYST